MHLFEPLAKNYKVGFKNLLNQDLAMNITQIMALKVILKKKDNNNKKKKKKNNNNNNNNNNNKEDFVLKH